MRITRYLRPGHIRMELSTCDDPERRAEIGEAAFFRQTREWVLREITEILEGTGNVGNANKLFLDLLNREKKASTALEKGLAIPHVRTRHARQFTMALARSPKGIFFGESGGRRTHFFLALIAPPHDDAIYLKIYRKMAELFLNDAFLEDLRAARDEHEILRTFQQYE